MVETSTVYARLHSLPVLTKEPPSSVQQVITR